MHENRSTNLCENVKTRNVITILEYIGTNAFCQEEKTNKTHRHLLSFFLGKQYGILDLFFLSWSLIDPLYHRLLFIPAENYSHTHTALQYVPLLPIILYLSGLSDDDLINQFNPIHKNNNEQ